uniref:Uncharacterized protein n=1 Tax=Lepeophtheirus salmonis TaxID=72036 RepID=A0A0K2T568_LEPSM
MYHAVFFLCTCTANEAVKNRGIGEGIVILH